MHIFEASARYIEESTGRDYILAVIPPRIRTTYHSLRVAAVLVAGAVWPAAARAQTVAEIQVTPETITLGVNQKQTIFAAAYDKHGNLIPSIKFTFRSSDTTIVRVLRDGTIIGIRPGLAKVEARAQGRRASLAVLITGAPDHPLSDKPPAGTLLTLDPAALVLLPAEPARLTAQALRDDGSAIPLGRVSWKSLKPEVAAVDSVGMVVGVVPGRTIIQATAANGLMATAPVEVAQAEFAVAPDRVVIGPLGFDTLQARVPAQGGRRLHSGIQWRSADSAIARVGPSGIVQGQEPGRTEIVAVGFGQERRVPVVVHKVPQALVVTPRQSEPVQISRGGGRKFSVVVEAADSTPIPEVPVTWAVGDTLAVTLDATTGILTAKALGTTTVTATVDGFDPVIWTIEVVPGIVRLNRERVSLLPGDHASVTAALLDERGQSVGEVSQLRWTSDHPDVAAVDASGNIQAVAPGRATVTGTPAWRHGDSTVVFVVGDLLVVSDRSGRPALYSAVLSKPDSLRVVLADSAANVGGRYSPDRTRIAFSSNRAGTFDLYVADADGRNPVRITTGPGSETEPVWTPDGARIVYTAAAPGASPQIYSVSAAGGDPRPLTTGPGGNYSPAVSRDGRTIAFVSTRDNNDEVYLMDADGGRPRRITNTSQREFLPQFFPNGDLLYAMERGRGKGARLIRRTPTIQQSAALFEIDQPLIAIALSADGERLAYAAGRAKVTLFLRLIGFSANPPVVVPLRPAEQVSHLAF